MLNRVVLVGRITKDPELKQVAQTGVVNFTLAVNRPYKKDGETVADFINCAAWEHQASFINNYVKKGYLISVDGTLETRSFEDSTGVLRYVTEVRVERVASLEKRDKVEDEQEKKVPTIEERKKQMNDEYIKRTKGITSSVKKKEIKEQIEKEFEEDLPF